MLRLTALLMLSSLWLARPSYAQNCSEVFDFFREGALMEYTNYDKKGKPESTSTHRIKRIEQNKDTLIANTDVTLARFKDGKEMQSYSVPIKCCKGVLLLSMRGFIPVGDNAAQNSDVSDIQVEISGGDLVFLQKLEVGQALPDSEMEMAMRMGSLQLMRNRYLIRDRKVEAEESVTTTAGTSNCYRISYNLDYQLLGTRTLRAEIWYSPSVGTVRSVSYDNKGKEMGRTELTKFSK